MADKNHTLYKVVLTGGIASGKSVVAHLFSSYGIDVFEADKVARELVQPGGEHLAKITEHFGSTILNDKGELNREKLREIIFENPQERAWMNQLLHPPIRERLLQLAQQTQAPYCLWVIPLLAETAFPYPAQRVLVLDCSREEQLSRLQARDKINRTEAERMINAQVDRETRLLIADDVITNHGTRNELTKQVERLHQQYLRLAKRIT